jgi:hypothetical protein
MSRPNQTASVERLIMRTFDFVDPERAAFAPSPRHSHCLRRFEPRETWGGDGRGGHSHFEASLPAQPTDQVRGCLRLARAIDPEGNR